MTKRFSEVDAGEEVVLSYDFTKGLGTGESLVNAPTIDVEVDYGTDATASSIVGNPQLVGNILQVPVASMKNDVDYHITVTMPTNDTRKTLVLAGILPVREA